jgi:hypothetical protein
MAVEWKKILLEGDTTTEMSLIKVSSDDTTPGYLDGKLVAGTAIDLTVGNPAGNETLEIKVEADGITAALIADDAVGSEHIEQLSAALDFGGNQAQDMTVHNVADAAARNGLTPVLGKMVFQADTLHPYICTSIA